MAARLDGQKMHACTTSVIAGMEPEETLVHDVRAELTPAQMVEHKLRALLRSSEPGAFAESSGLLRSFQGTPKTCFRMTEAVQEGRLRADQRIKDLATKRSAVHLRQTVKEPMPEFAAATPVPKSRRLTGP